MNFLNLMVTIYLHVPKGAGKGRDFRMQPFSHELATTCMWELKFEEKTYLINTRFLIRRNKKVWLR